MAARLGVDLGTTWTAAALSDGGRPEALTLGTHGFAMPSVVALDGGELVAGEAAERRMTTDPASGAREVKRRLGDTTPLVVGGQPFGAEALMAALLRQVIRVAEERAGGPIETVALTHPANWGAYKLDLVREIGRLANRDDVELVAEPVAAALHYASLGRLAAGDTVAVYDFGGGTFDVAVVRLTDSGAELLGSPGGLERLGGVDLDQVVLVHVDGALDGALRALDTTSPDARAAIGSLREACTRAKEALSTDADTVIPVVLPSLHTEVRITRAEFEAAIRSRLDDTLGALDRVLGSAGVEAGALAGVLLVGGSSRIPAVAERVGEHTGVPVLVDVDAKTVVALGAAGQGAAASATPAAAGAEPAGVGGGGGGGGRGGRTEARAGRGERGGAATGVVAGVAAAGAVTAAGAYAYRELTDDDGGDDRGDRGERDERRGDRDAGDAKGAKDDEAAFIEALAADDSMDAFDAVASGGGGGFAGGGGGAASAGGAYAARPSYAYSSGSSGAGDGGYVFSDSPAGRVAAQVFAAAPAATSTAPAAVPGSATPAGTAGAPTATPTAPGTPAAPGAAGAPAGQGAPPATPLFTDPQLEAVRDQLRERLATFTVPEGADPEEAAELRRDLEGLLDRYQPYPGQSVDDAVATLRYQFEDRVRDFAQDQRLDALIEAEQAERDAAAALEAEIDAARTELTDRLDAWQPPEGADPAAVEALRGELAAMLDRFTPIPGQTADDALADLRARFNDRVRDFAQDQKLDAVIDELAVPDDGAAPPPAAGTATDAPAGEEQEEPAAGEEQEEPAAGEEQEEPAAGEEQEEPAAGGNETATEGEEAEETSEVEVPAESEQAAPAEEEVPTAAGSGAPASDAAQVGAEAQAAESGAPTAEAARVAAEGEGRVVDVFDEFVEADRDLGLVADPVAADAAPLVAAVDADPVMAAAGDPVLGDAAPLVAAASAPPAVGDAAVTMAADDLVGDLTVPEPVVMPPAEAVMAADDLAAPEVELPEIEIPAPEPVAASSTAEALDELADSMSVEDHTYEDLMEMDDAAAVDPVMADPTLDDQQM